MRLIDADELKKNFQDELCKGIACAECSMQVEGVCRAERWIDIAPTIDAEPIKHGHWTRWLDTRFGRLLNDIIICSNCNVAFSSEQQIRRSYCPNCGAKMDEVEEKCD